MLKKLSQLSVTQINWAVARILGHQWRCPWIASVDSYQAWITYEQAWGNPHPDYCNDWNAASAVMVKYGIFPEVNEIHRHDDGSVTTSLGFLARTPAEILDDITEGHAASTPLAAVMLCFLNMKVGNAIEVPGEIP